MRKQLVDVDDIEDYEIPEEDDDIDYDQDQFYDEMEIDAAGQVDEDFIIQDDDGSI